MLVFLGVSGNKSVGPPGFWLAPILYPESQDLWFLGFES